MNAHKEMLAGYADPDAGYHDADHDVTWLKFKIKI